MDPDTLAALARYVADEAVSSARILEVIPGAYAVRCHAADGSDWFVATDRYACAYGWADTLPDALERLAAALPAKAEPTYAARYAANARTLAAQLRDYPPATPDPTRAALAARP